MTQHILIDKVLCIDYSLRMAYLSLKSDFIFKKLFTEEPEFLVDLVNAVLDLPENLRIAELQVLNPEIPPELISDKTSIFDIRAVNESGEQIIIEMQAFPQAFYAKRALYYWAKTYSTQLAKGEDYLLLKKVYSINFVDFKLIDSPDYHTVFDIIARNNNDIQLSENFEMHILELKKFGNTVDFTDKINIWMYIINNTESIGEDIMKTIVDKQPVMEKVFDRLDKMSTNKTLLSEYEIRKRAAMDEKARLDYSFDKGIEKGIEKGVEKEKLETAKLMLKDGLDVKVIMKYTGLSKEEILKIE